MSRRGQLGEGRARAGEGGQLLHTAGERQRRQRLAGRGLVHVEDGFTVAGEERRAVGDR